MTSLAERSRTLNTLICLLKEVRGYVTTVELRKESSVIGCLDHVDDKMNITMSDVVYKGIDETEIRYDLFYVQGKNVRFVHIPDSIDMIGAIRAHVLGVQKNVVGRTERKPYRKRRDIKQLQREFLQKKQEELLIKLGMASEQES